MPTMPTTTALIRIQTNGSLVFQMYLWERDSLERNLEVQNLLLGLIFGFLFLMVVINVLFRFSLKDNRFLWYAVYVASLSFFLMVYTGWLRFLALPLRFPQDLSTSTKAVTTTTGISGWSRRSCTKTSSPERSGKPKSSRTKSTFVLPRIAKASCPLWTATHWSSPSTSKRLAVLSKTVLSSSTTRTVSRVWPWRCPPL